MMAPHSHLSFCTGVLLVVCFPATAANLYDESSLLQVTRIVASGMQRALIGCAGDKDLLEDALPPKPKTKPTGAAKRPTAAAKSPAGAAKNPTGAPKDSKKAAQSTTQSAVTGGPDAEESTTQSAETREPGEETTSGQPFSFPTFAPFPTLGPGGFPTFAPFTFPTINPLNVVPFEPILPIAQKIKELEDAKMQMARQTAHGKLVTDIEGEGDAARSQEQKDAEELNPFLKAAITAADTMMAAKIKLANSARDLEASDAQGANNAEQTLEKEERDWFAWR